MRERPATLDGAPAKSKCLCGCGATTAIARKTDKRYGIIKGKPQRFVRGHHRRVSDKARYEARAEGFSTPCWLWRGYVGAHGYGQTGTDLAHRYFYEKYVGRIPDDLVVHHVCGVKTCVNPDHLELASRKDNASVVGKLSGSTKTNGAAQKTACAEEDRGHTTGCWIWQGRTDPAGYGKLGRKLAHRVMYEIRRGPIPDGMDLDHLCRIRSCVNPQHLEAVTRAENIRRGKLGKLTLKAVRLIRADGSSTYAELGDKYGVASGYIGMLKNRRRWRDAS